MLLCTNGGCKPVYTKANNVLIYTVLIVQCQYLAALVVLKKKIRKKIKKREESGHDENFTRRSGHCPRVSLADAAAAAAAAPHLPFNAACMPASPMPRLPAPQRGGGGGSSGSLPAIPMHSSSAMTLNA